MSDSASLAAPASSASTGARKAPPANKGRPRPAEDEEKPTAADAALADASIDHGSPGAAPPSLPPREDTATRLERQFKGLPPPTEQMSRTELATQYRPYVRSIAGKIKKTLSKEIEFDDLVSYGMLGLFEAAERYDAKFGANFMTFAYYRVRGAIYDGLRGMGWVSRTEYQRYRFEARANAYLGSHHEQQVASSHEVPIKRSTEDEVNELGDVVEHLVTIYVTALDAMEGFQIKDDRGPSIDESLEILQARRLVAEAIEKLPDQEKKLLKLYYYEEMSLEDVGKELGLSKSWTSRLHTRTIKRLSRLLRDLLAEYKDEGAANALLEAGGVFEQQTGPPGR